ncbi:MAG: lecithin retinol acyltransferase family protein [Sterolibacterium sp.]|jgi:hypothetical protein
MVTLAPGYTIGVQVGPITHVGIVSDKYVNGVPMVISNSRRTGGVAEEPLNIFQGGYALVDVAQATASMPVWQVLLRARSMIGSRWNLFSWNCEHFVNWAYGFEAKSRQLDQASAFAGVALLLVGLARA